MIKELKKDNSIFILPADKGRATVVIDATSYEQKALSLLQDDKVYAKLKKKKKKLKKKKNPTQKFKAYQSLERTQRKCYD